MELVYVYLLAWVLGGVWLGTSMLLEQREPPESEGVAAPARASSRLASLGTFALIGFGLCGLAAEGLGLVSSPYTALLALVGGAVLAVIGYALVDHTRHA